MIYKKYTNENYNLYTIKTDKFKSCLMEVVFSKPLDKSKVTSWLPNWVARYIELFEPINVISTSSGTPSTTYASSLYLTVTGWSYITSASLSDKLITWVSTNKKTAIAKNNDT